MRAEKLVILIVLCGFCGCISPYSYLPRTNLASNNRAPDPQPVYLKPVVEANKVHPFAEMVIKGVEKDSPAEKAGLQTGDKILTINGKAFGTMETFFEYLKKTRWLPKTYRVVRRENGSYVEKEMTVKPEANFFYSGILHKCIDGEGKVFYPRGSSDAQIYQAGDKFSVTATMGYESSLLVLLFNIANLSDADLNFDKSQILLLDSQKTMFPMLSHAKVVTQQYADTMACDPMAALRLAPTIMSAQNEKNDTPIHIPQGTNRSDKVYVSGENVKLPIKAKIKIENETFEFQFA